MSKGFDRDANLVVGSTIGCFLIASLYGFKIAIAAGMFACAVALIILIFDE